MCRLTDGQYLPISFLPSQGPARLPEQFRRRRSDGCRVLLWIILGGIFFGAVTDFGALYASVKNDGKSMGLLIEKYIGKAGRKLFLGFCWLFCLIVIAAFADMVAGTFDAYVVTDGVKTLSENASDKAGRAGSISLFFILFAVIFGVVQHKMKFTGWKEVVFGLVCTVLAFVCGMNFPVILVKTCGYTLHLPYIFLAAVLPMWFVMQPRDYMSTFMFVGMIAGRGAGSDLCPSGNESSGIYRI